MKRNTSRAVSPTPTAFSGISNYRNTDLKFDYRSVSKEHHNELGKYLANYLEKEAPNSRSTARPKLKRLTVQQFHELSTDVLDESLRRRTEDQVPYFPVRKEFHPNRNQARQKLATLPITRFEDLSSDVYYELARRYPEFQDPLDGRGSNTSNYDDYPASDFPSNNSALLDDSRTSGRRPTDRPSGGSVSGRRPSGGRRRPSEVEYSGRRNEERRQDDLDREFHPTQSTNASSRVMGSRTSVADDARKMRTEYEYKIATLQMQLSNLQRDLINTTKAEKLFQDSENRVKQLEEELSVFRQRVEEQSEREEALHGMKRKYNDMSPRTTVTTRSGGKRLPNLKTRGLSMSEDAEEDDTDGEGSKRAVIDNFNNLKPLEELEKYRSHSAAFNSAARFDPPRLAESTRFHIIQVIDDWVNNDGDTSSLFWLHGGAGVGKSALAQSLSEKYLMKNQLAASFFFFRGDPTRNNGDRLIPTLVSHLVHNVEGISPFVEDNIRQNLGLFTESYQFQVQKLLIEPFLALKSFTHPQLIVIDGLDECENPVVQGEFLRVIARATRRIPHLRFLVTSRSEAHITHIFNHDPDLQAIAVPRYNLSDDPDADVDILRFLENEFVKIRRTHPLRSHLPDNWPDRKAITSLVERSSEHFIHASTVIQYIRSPKHRPDDRLEVVLRLRPPQEGDRPYAQLDAMYSLIFEGIEIREQLERICLVLGILYFYFQNEKVCDCATIEKLLELKPGDLVLLLDPILSLIAIDGDKVRVSHKSLFAYLLDPTRGGHLPFDLSRVRPYIQLDTLDTHLGDDQDMDEQNLFMQKIKPVLDVLTAVESMSNAIRPLRIAILGLVDVMTTSRADWQGDQSDELVHVTAAMTALAWIFQKYQAASVPLPGMVAKYTMNLTDLLNSHIVPVNRHNRDGTATKPLTPHIASVFLIESTDDMRHDAGGDGPCLKSIFVTDFNGRQAYVPLELCACWLDLCVFLEMFLRGEKENHFIANRKFGVRVPDKVDLLSEATWDSWINHSNQGGGASYATIDLYAIVNDDSNSCPACKIPNPVQLPLPPPGNVQQCQSCQFTFLECYQEGSGSEEPGSDSIHVRDLTRSTSGDALVQLNSVEHRPTLSESALSSDIRPSTQGSEISAVSPAVIDSNGGSSVPKHIQVVRRRKPYNYKEDDNKAVHADETLPIALTTGHQAIALSPTLDLHVVTICHVLYTFLLFRLPDRYRKSADSQISGHERYTWEAFRDNFKFDITYFGIPAGIMFGALFTTLQISSAVYDPIIRTAVHLSIVCLFFGLIYSLVLWVTFEKKFEIKRITRMDKVPQNKFWNLWIMLSMPLVWISWGFIYFALFLVAFLWRSGATDQLDEKSIPSPNDAYGPRAFTTLVFVIGIAYFVMIIRTTNRISHL